MESKQKIVLGVIGLAAIGVGIFMYVSRPLPAPTQTGDFPMDTGDSNALPN